MFNSIFGSKKKRTDECYYDVDDAVIRFENPIKHDGPSEYQFVSSQDGRVMAAGDVMYIIDAEWLQKWSEFCAQEPVGSPPKLKLHHPGRITNNRLVSEIAVSAAANDGQSEHKFRDDLVLKEHFRPVHRYIWQFLFQKYGGGPVITFFIPEGCTDKQYRKGTWVKTVASVIPAIVNIIPTSHVPKKRASVNLTEPILEGQRRWAEAEAADAEIERQQAEVAKVQALELKKLRLESEAMQLQQDIENDQASIVLQSMVASGKINQVLDQAKQTHDEQLQTVVGDIATVFQLANESSKLKVLRNVPVEQRSDAQNEELRSGCALVIQIRYRSRLKQRKVQELKQKAYALKVEGYARKLQSLWRVRLARRQIASRRDQRRELMALRAVILVQNVWRKRKARMYLTALRNANIKQKIVEAELAREHIARRRIIELLRVLLDRIRVRRLLMAQQMHSIYIHVHSAHKLLPGKLTGLSDPFVRVAGSRLKLNPGQVQIPSPAAVVSGKKRLVKPHGAAQTVCLGSTKHVLASLNPVWEQEVLLSGLYGGDYIVFNVYDRDSFGGDKFLGQAEICLLDYPQLFRGVHGGAQRGCVVDLPDLELRPCATAIHDGKGAIITGTDVIPTGSKSPKSRGHLKVTLKLPVTSRSVCGWMYKYSSSAVIGMPRSFKRRWMVLTDESLQYYDNLYSLDDPRYTVACKDVSLIENTSDESTGILESMTVAFGRDSWQLKFVEEDDQFKREKWLNRITLCCYNIGFRSKNTASRLAAYPVLHGVRQLVNKTLLNPDNIDVTNLPYAPSAERTTSVTSAAASGTVATSTTPQRRGSGTAAASVGSVNSTPADINRSRSRTASNAADTPPVGSANSSGVKTKRRSSFLGGVLDKL